VIRGLRASQALKLAALTEEPTTVYAVTHKALASAIKVIARADDSSGIIGDACRRLLDLHPKAAAAAKVSTDELIDWMMKSSSTATSTTSSSTWSRMP